jgi:hypothetical protein
MQSYITGNYSREMQVFNEIGRQCGGAVSIYPQVEVSEWRPRGLEIDMTQLFGSQVAYKPGAAKLQQHHNSTLRLHSVQEQCRHQLSRLAKSAKTR